MTRFQDYSLMTGRSAADYFDEIRDFLLEASSVEVIKYLRSDGLYGVFYRVWWGERGDGSGAVDADPEREY